MRNWNTEKPLVKNERNASSFKQVIKPLSPILTDPLFLDSQRNKTSKMTFADQLNALRLFYLEEFLLDTTFKL